MKEVIIKIPIDETEKIINALNHIQLTGDEHIDAVLDILNVVLKEELDKQHPKNIYGNR